MAPPDKSPCPQGPARRSGTDPRPASRSGAQGALLLVPRPSSLPRQMPCPLVGVSHRRQSVPRPAPTLLSPETSGSQAEGGQAWEMSTFQGKPRHVPGTECHCPEMWELGSRGSDAGRRAPGQQDPAWPRVHLHPGRPGAKVRHQRGRGVSAPGFAQSQRESQRPSPL